MLRQISLVFSILLVAIVIPVQGFEQTMPEIIVTDDQPETVEAAYQFRVREMYEEANLEKLGLTFPVYTKAVTGYFNLKALGQLSEKQLLTVIDFEKSSNQKRFCVIDLGSNKVLFNSLVELGRNTGNEFAKYFSNTNQSFMSSLGFYVTDDLYFGKHGLSLKLRGMDDNFNSNAMERAVVMHGADYVSEEFIRRNGRLGRSLGCPALPNDLNPKVVEAIKNGTCLFIHYPTNDYFSKYLNTQFAMQELLKISPDVMMATTGQDESQVN